MYSIKITKTYTTGQTEVGYLTSRPGGDFYYSNSYEHALIIEDIEYALRLIAIHDKLEFKLSPTDIMTEKPVMEIVPAYGYDLN